MNLNDDPHFRYYRKASELRNLLVSFIDKTDMLDFADEILRERQLNALPPNRVVAIARKLQVERDALKPLIRKASIALAKEPLNMCSK